MIVAFVICQAQVQPPFSEKEHFQKTDDLGLIACFTSH